MPAVGQTISHFKLAELLGRGGMGEVYRAKDLTLGRDVAIKVLPEAFTLDPDRVARFQREGKLLASLNHPNIATIHGIEVVDGIYFLVLELVEGETLQQRLASEAGARRAVPLQIDEALRIARQIAEALEAAHEKGIIHRDLKPANIKITPEGKVKILDFGLAKAFAEEASAGALSESPTLSIAATRQGIILGTAAYMSPEQARGKMVDKQTDIWAFGCVLYEMLTGQAAFKGEDVSEILAAVIKGDADLDLLSPDTPPRLRELLSRCLQKDLKQRYRDAGDVLIELEQAMSRSTSAETAAASIPQSKLRLVLPWIAAVVILSIVGAGIAVWKLKPAEQRQVVRLYYELPKDQQFSRVGIPIPLLAISPDGKQFVYGTPGGLYSRRVDELEAKLIPGTDTNPSVPFFSPDGQWIGYHSNADKKLKKIPVNGGTPVSLCDTPAITGASWGRDDAIIYEHFQKGIMRVSAGGGAPELIFKAEKEAILFPQMLPDSKSILCTRFTAAGQKVALLSIESGKLKELFAGDSAQYLPTGHLVYGSGNSIFAVEFDSVKLEAKGTPVSVVDGVWRPGMVSQFAVSGSGALVYVPALPEQAGSGRTLVWVNRDGREEPLDAPPNLYKFPKISPDGKRLAITIPAGGKTDVWVWDFLHKNLTRLTFDGGSVPLWTPDGRRIVYSSTGNGRYPAIFWKAADGTGESEQLGSMPDMALIPGSLSADGGALVVGEFRESAADMDIGVLSLGGNHELKQLLQEKYAEGQPQISSDGRWITYSSNDSGSNGIYVCSFPEVHKGRWQISTGNGDSPLWSRDGREIFYRDVDAVVAVSVKTGPSFSVEGTPKVLFRGTYIGSLPDMDGTPWDISPDGKRFLMIKPPPAAADGGPRRINLVLNWLEELKQRVPVQKK